MMARDNRLTAILTLKDRAAFTFRWMAYANRTGFPFKILIADGGQDPNVPQVLSDKNNYPNLEYDYIRYPYDANYAVYHAKKIDALRRVQTPYVVFADNDDFYVVEGLSQSVDFLDQHPDYATCKGYTVSFLLQPELNALNGDITRFDYQAAMSLEQAAAAERVNTHFCNYATTYYDVHRIDMARRLFQTLQEADPKDTAVSELLTSLMSAALGKIKLIPVLYLFRQHHQDTNCYREDLQYDRFDRMLWPTWSVEFGRLVHEVATLVAGQDGLPLIEATARVQAGYRKYVAPIIVNALRRDLDTGATFAPPAFSRETLLQDTTVTAMSQFLSAVKVLTDAPLTEPADRSRAGRLIRRAEQHMRNGQWHSALNPLEQALTLQSARPGLLAAAGHCLIQLRRIPEGLAYFQRAADLQPASTEACLNLAKALSLDGRWEEAGAACQRVLVLDPQHRSARHTLGEIYLKQARVEEGAQLLTQLVQDYPEDVPVLVTLAEAAWLSGDLDKALRWWEQVIQIDVAYARARETLNSPWATEHGRAVHRLRRQGQWSEALNRLEQLLAARPNWAEGHLEMGDALYALGRVEEARLNWQRANQLQPQLAESKTQEANARIARHHFEEAFTSWQQAISLRPGEIDMFARIQDPFFHYGQLGLANRLLQRIVDENQRIVKTTSLNTVQARFLRLYTNQIGHMGHLDWYVKMDQLGKRSPHRPIITADNTPNPSYLQYWRRYIPDIVTDPAEVEQLISTGRFLEDGLVAVLDADGQQIADYSYAPQVAIQKQWEAEGRPPLLALSEEDTERGRACLQQHFGLPREAWFVSLHVRDDRMRHSSQGTRNGRIDSYFAAIRSITERGGWVIRMGDPTMPLLPAMPQVIDYAHSVAKSDWMDVFLWAKCRFFVGTNSGPIFIPPTFGVPVVATNWSPLGIPDLFINGLCIFKQYWSEREKRYLTYPEVLASDLGFTNVPDLVSNLGVQHLDNSPEEINEVVLEMLERLEGRLTYTEADQQLQSRFDHLPGKVPGVGRVGRAFLQKYADLLEATPARPLVLDRPTPTAPRLSVIIPNYNHAKYLAGTLEAILTQSRPPDEVIVVDDASTDKSVDIIRGFAERYPNVRLIQNERNRGVVDSINSAVEMTTGEYVFCQAADDQVRPGFFEKGMRLLSQHPEAGLCCAKSSRLDIASGKSVENCPHLSDEPRYFSPEECAQLIRASGRYPIEGNTVILKRSAYYEAGGYIPELKWHGDWFYLLVIAFTRGMCYLPEVLAINRTRSDSYSGRGIRDWSQQREVINHLLHLLALPTFDAVKGWFAHSNVLSFLLPAALADDDLSLHLLPDYPYNGLALMHTAALFLKQDLGPSPAAFYGNIKFVQILLNKAQALLGNAIPNLQYLRAAALYALNRPAAARAAAQAELALQPGHPAALMLLPQIARLPPRQEPHPQPFPMREPIALQRAASSPGGQPTIFQRAESRAWAVDVVIPVYGQAALVQRCVESALKTAPAAHLILMDDCSPGGEIAALFKRWESHPQITLARTPSNSGFIGACRLGASLGSALFILFLNSDTEAVEPGWLEKLIPAENDIAIVGAKLLYPPDLPGPLAGTIQHAGVARSTDGVPYHPFLGLPADTPEADAPREVNAVTGACLLVRRQVWDALGGWDARFGKGVYEDVDLCWQARKNRYRVLYQPAATLYHHESASKAPDGRHELNAHTLDNLEKLLTKWRPLASDEDLFFGEKTARRWERARKHVQRAKAALNQRNTATALAATRKAVATAPDLPEALIGYAQVLSTQGDHTAAAEHFEKAIRLAPSAWDTRLRLVDEWIAAGAPERAAAELIALEAVFPQAAEVKQRAATLAPFALFAPRSAPEETPQPASSAPGAARTLQLLLDADDLPAALQQHAGRLDADLLALVGLNAKTARADGNAELAEGLEALAEYVTQAAMP